MENKIIEATSHTKLFKDQLTALLDAYERHEDELRKQKRRDIEWLLDQAIVKGMIS